MLTFFSMPFLTSNVFAHFVTVFSKMFKPALVSVFTKPYILIFADIFWINFWNCKMNWENSFWRPALAVVWSGLKAGLLCSTYFACMTTDQPGWSLKGFKSRSFCNLAGHVSPFFPNPSKQHSLFLYLGTSSCICFLASNSQHWSVWLTASPQPPSGWLLPRSG